MPEGPRSDVAGAVLHKVLLAQIVSFAGGAVAAAVYLRLLFADLPRTDLSGGVGELLVAYLAGIVIAAVGLAWFLLDRSLGWVRAGRAPTTRERRWTVAQPVAQSITAFGVWIGAAVAYALLNRADPTAVRVAIGITLAGVITCCLLELLLARQLRPLLALALAHAPPPSWRHEVLTRVMVGWALGCAVPLAAIGLALLSLSGETTELWANRLAVVVLTTVVLGGVVLLAAATAVAGRIEEVIDAQSRVEADDLDVRLDVTNIGEVGRLQYGFNTMVDGLRERRRLRELVGRQVGLDVSREELAREPRLGGETREISALFVDLEGFTTLTEQHSPEEVVAELNRFFGVVISSVHREGGWVNTFSGDAVLCIFGAPDDQPDHATRALRVAGALPRALGDLPGPPRVGIGAATGRVVVGNIGTPERHEYTVIGDPVNVAARLADLAKRPFHGVLASEETMRAAGSYPSRWHEAGTVVLRGRSRPTRLFEPAPADDADDTAS